MPIRMQDAIFGGTGLGVVIEEDCWIGINSVIMPGVTIGKGSIVGSNSVVTKNIAPYSIAVGAPCKVVMHRLDFTLKNSIQSSKLEDWPYFYSGFEYLYDENNSNHSCFTISQEIVFAVDTFNASKIKIKYFLDENTDVSMRHNDCALPLSGGMNEVIFDINTNIPNRILVTMSKKLNIKIIEVNVLNGQENG